MFHIPVTDRLNKRRPCVQKTIGRSGTLFCHFLLILVLARYTSQTTALHCVRDSARGTTCYYAAVASRRSIESTCCGPRAILRAILRCFHGYVYASHGASGTCTTPVAQKRRGAGLPCLHLLTRQHTSHQRSLMDATWRSRHSPQMD
jgi:hypothetical protein